MKIHRKENNFDKYHDEDDNMKITMQITGEDHLSVSPSGQAARLCLMLEPVLLISHALTARAGARAHVVPPLEMRHQLAAPRPLLHAALHP